MKITDFAKFATLTEDERKAEFAKMSAEDITASLTEATTEATSLFALDAPTVEDADKAESVVASIGFIEAERDARTAAVEAASKRFADAKAKFSVNDGVESGADEDEEDEEEDGDAEDAEDGDEDADDADADDAEDGDVEVEAATKRKKKNPFDKDAESEDEVTTAAANPLARQRLRTSAAKQVGRKTKRPAAKASADVVITAAADVPEFATGQRMSGLSEVAQAVMNRVKGFPTFNRSAAEAVASQSNGQPVLHKFGTASFAVDFDDALTASRSAESGYDAVKESVKRHVERVTASLNPAQPEVQTAAMAWCSPSEVVYNWIADYVVDGLLDLPEIAAPRGGLLLTEGPQLAQTAYGTPEAVDEFGFGGTEAEMEAGYVKTCETIECPEWVDHRLDFDGYCWKIPILTEATFPELVADAMRLSDVLYAHKMNRRFIRDVLAQSDPVNATNALGGTMLDTLEAFTQVAIKERRWWNLGENAVMEVKLPQEARTIFQFDMARRSGLALTDTATIQKVAAHFAAHNLAVTYISDFDQRYGSATPTADWPETIRGIMYPAGTFVKSVKPVINLSSVYDAASLSENEYTGVFFEQGVMTIKRGYRSHVIEVPVCVAGRTGANDLTCTAFDGSF